MKSLFGNVQHNSGTASCNFIINYQFNPIEKVEELYERFLKRGREKSGVAVGAT